MKEQKIVYQHHEKIENRKLGNHFQYCLENLPKKQEKRNSLISYYSTKSMIPTDF